MRLIDADSLISLVMDSTILGNGFKQAFVAIVNGEPTIQPEQRWIPCNERLPEEDGEYLVTLKSDYMHYTTKAWFFVKYKIWNKQYDEGGYEARITAWMPTPEPYREEDGS